MNWSFKEKVQFRKDYLRMKIWTKEIGNNKIGMLSFMIVNSDFKNQWTDCVQKEKIDLCGELEVINRSLLKVPQEIAKKLRNYKNLNC